VPSRPPIHQAVFWRPPGANASARRPRDDFYHSPAWGELRAATLERAGYLCEIGLPGCYGDASTADHIKERKDGGADALFNLRATCAACHNRRHPEKGRSRDD
jgi:5-methylcytosine-specific restriction protein A